VSEDHETQRARRAEAHQHSDHQHHGAAVTTENWAPPQSALARTLLDSGPSGNGAAPPRQSRLLLLVIVAGAVALAIVKPWVALAIGALIVMIFLHELGHYITAKRSGMKVTQFFLFFGPTIWSFRRGETEYGIKAIPLGAFVKVIGMNNLDPHVDPADEPRTYRQASYPRRVLMASAGSLMHFLIAFVLFAVALFGYGEVKDSSWALSGIKAGTPAAAAGLRDGDRIVSVDGQAVGTYDDLRPVLRNNPGKRLVMEVERGGVVSTVPVTLGSTCDGGSVGYLGVSRTLVPIGTSIGGAVVGSAREVTNGLWINLKGLGRVFSPAGVSRMVDQVRNEPPTEDPSQPVVCSGLGPVERASSIIGITSGVAGAAEAGLWNFLYVMAFINLAIGLINLFPMLPFDGGHIAVATYERLRQRNGQRYHADITKLLPVVYSLLIFMVAIMLSAGYLDITRGFGN
jgi:membrane-associated protease RseP (regulator of RpoE activity)